MTGYHNLESVLLELEKTGRLVRIKEEIDPHLEMAAIQRRIYAHNGPALLFENVKGCLYRCVSNIFGSLETSKYLFRKTLPTVQKVIDLKSHPEKALRSPLQNMSTVLKALNALPKKLSPKHIDDFEEISINDLPQIKCWEQDGGAFITLPQVYSENPEQPGVLHANLGMYRIQISGNDYIQDQEIGLHYQIHRGIGINHAKAQKLQQPLKVSIFVGGHPAHTLAAVMPLPEGMSELTFAGLLAGRRFRYFQIEGFTFSADADFVITGTITGTETKPEGPFGDHLGYYSLTHPFPVMQVHKVYAKENAIWPFTVVGRPPQEDTSFGDFIHEITGNAISTEIPGVKEVHAVDAAGVHPLLLAIGTERYTPYLPASKPAEILTQANRILGTGQLSLAKYLFIAADADGLPRTRDMKLFFQYLLEHIDFETDIHFQTCTTIDTLDYSGTALNEGSKVVFAVAGEKKRSLCTSVHPSLKEKITNITLVHNGILAIQLPRFSQYENATTEINTLMAQLKEAPTADIGLIVVCDDADFLAKEWNNFLWVTFTRSDPAHDIYGMDSFTRYKHWGCTSPVVIDARIKPHHAPVLAENETIKEKIEHLFKDGAPLSGY
ncbi:MAG: UbiD family decarboxylase [Chitinophagaceae bacterium]